MNRLKKIIKKKGTNKRKDILACDWKNQYCENVLTAQSDLQIQHNPY